MNLRNEIVALIHRAIDSTMNYSGDEKELNMHNWEQITADRIIGAITQTLPEPIDTKQKYETDDSNGIYVNITGEETDDIQIDHLRNFSEDVGWNKYYVEYMECLRRLYTVPEPVVQSEHARAEDITIHGTDSGEDDSNREQSKVR